MMWLLFITPKKLLSRLVGWVAQRPWPSWLQRPLNRWFATRYQLNMQEALPYQDPAAYSTGMLCLLGRLISSFAL